MAEAPWAKDVDTVLKELDVSKETGLDEAEAAARLEKYGRNELRKEEGSSFWQLVLEQFDDPLVKILLVAAVISAGIAFSEVHEAGESLSVEKFVEPLVILLILVLNAMVGVYQESNAEKSLEALKAMQPETARTLRGGEWVSELPAETLVPGDVLELRVGDRVPADCRVLQLKTTTLRAEQSALTGESVAVSKLEEAVAEVDCEIQSKTCMLFAGTALANGHVLALVTATGGATEMGKIQEQLEAAAAERAEEKTPLKQKLEEFSDMLQWIISGICVLVWVINYRMFIDLETYTVDVKAAIYYFQIAVALAVAAIPEGLPTVITMCLALGTRKMAARNSIVRKLPAVETLGCTTVICSDKTGTLTTNMMSVRQVIVLAAGGAQAETTKVSGSTYDPSDGSADLANGRLSPALEKLAQVAALCNDSTVERKPDGRWKHVGAPTEAALTVLVEKLLGAGGRSSAAASDGATALPANERLLAATTKKATLEFTRDRKSMSVIVGAQGKTRNSDHNELLVKGAAETLLERCTHALDASGARVPLSDAAREAMHAAIARMAENALRCLGFAYKDELGDLAHVQDFQNDPAAKPLTQPDNFVKVEQELTFVGLVGMQDPPRAEVRDSMEACRRAGIRVMVITGDNKLTAEAVCREIAVFGADEDISEKSFVGKEFSRLPVARQKELLRASPHTGMVFSRAEPAFKQQIVKLLKEDGNVVAMTGDGVNDAPALKMADIGVAMGIAGTEVAKEAADMILADDNFSTIVASVQEGRAIYDNMRAFIRYMISSNIGEVFSIFFVAALGLPEGMVPIQLLWVNLVTDGPPATALGFNPSDPDIMTKPPRDKSEPLISTWVLVRYLIIGFYVGFATVGSFVTWYAHGEGSAPFLGLIPLGGDGHTSVDFLMLSNWDKCNVTTNEFALPGRKPFEFTAAPWTDAAGATHAVSGCDFFGAEGKSKASTLSLSVLVTIEMFNALNAISEDGSLLAPGTHPFVNPYLLLAMASSFALHFLILYTPQLAPMFDVVPLDRNEWALVVLYSAPVVLIDEVLKFAGRTMNNAARARREARIAADKKAN